MNERTELDDARGQVGPFWVVEDQGRATVLTLAKPLERAVDYGGLLILEESHRDYWTSLAK